MPNQKSDTEAQPRDIAASETKEPQVDAGTDEASCSIDFICEVCGFYPLVPVHGHFECSRCRYKTKCCEGAA